MNTRHLALFREVAKTRNMTQVAHQLHISQPAISMQLNRLEEQVGVRLFTMIGRQISLTDAGQAFLEYADEILSLEEQLSRVMDEFVEGRRGKVIIGASLGVGTYLLPPFIQSFSQVHPQVFIDLQICADDQIEKLVRNGHFDLGFTMKFPEEHFGLRITSFTTDFLIGLKPALLSVPPKLWIPKDIAGLCTEFHTMQATKATNYTGTTEIALISNLSTAIAPSVLIDTMEVNCLESMELVKRYVMAGLGYGIVLRSCIESDLSPNHVQIWDEYPQKEISLCIITRPAEHLSRSTWLFLHHLRVILP